MKYRLYRILIIVCASLLAGFCFVVSILLLFSQNLSDPSIINLISFVNEYFVLSINYGILGFSMLFMIIFGVPELIGAFLIFARKKSGIVVTFSMSFVIVSFAVLFMFVMKSYVFQSIVIVLSIAQFVLSILANNEYYHHLFRFNPSDYENIGYQKDILVLYYKENEYVEKHAYYIADMLKGQLAQITIKDPIKDSKLYDQKYAEEFSIATSVFDEEELKNIHIITSVKKGKIILPTQILLHNLDVHNIRIYIEIVSSRLYTGLEIKKMLKPIIKLPYKAITTRLLYGTVIERRKIN